ncbi:hypothetical protein NIES4071_24600 [Calothrix sp. NIES-4071]|nr:hypothetical protein NIES4071_24600 [Calothrix sp. NIES-4071]BAZ56783.1 hypothetical protein NIES4105_24540 [Calothrix sp. NIES-4105]
MQINSNDLFPQRRPLPVIVLLDVSGSMEGEKIATSVGIINFMRT